MRFLGVAADRLLGLVLPGVTAGACCIGFGTKSTESCGCGGNGIGLRKSCIVTCDCKLSCGACNIKVSVPSCR